jgi:uncharacterized membrane protein
MRKLSVLALVLLLFSLPSWGWAKSYFHPLIEQTFTLKQNGDVQVVEKRSFAFEGSFSWARLSIFRKGVRDIIFEGVWDEKSGEPCSFEVERSSQEVAIRWFYQAADETRTFRIRYRLVQAVRCFEDVAEFYWKVIEDQHARIDELSAEFFLPEASPELLKLFVHTQAAPGEMTFPEDRKSVRFRLQDIPADTFVEARLLARPEVFVDVPRQPLRRYEAILEEERGFAEGTIPTAGIVVLFLFGMGAVAYMVLFGGYYFRYGREPRLSYEREYEQEPPRLLPPAFLGVLLSQKRDMALLARAFLATILDLARRGYLTVHEKEERTLFFRKEILSFRLTEKGKEREAGKDLDALEKEVLSLLKTLRSSPDDAVTTRDIEEWGKKVQGGKSNMFRFLEKWDEELRKKVEEQYFPLLDKTAERKKRLFTGLGVAYFVAVFLTIFVGHASLSFFGFLLVPLALLVVFFMFLVQRFLSRWTPEAALEYRRWMAFRRFLTDFSLLKEAPVTLLALWDQYLVYAVVLGVAEKLLQNIKRYVQETQASFQVPSWYYPAHGTALNLASMGGIAHLDHLSRSIENMVNLGKALGASTTSGGGFSGGGGGGGGGGSSSAG